jgi:hypothetical protein
MKKITLLFLVLIAFTMQSNAQVQVGDGTYTSAFNTYPINPYYGYSYAQSIYLASEINSVGDITSISFEMADTEAIDNSDDMIDLWIGHTTKTVFDSTEDWVDVSTLTQVMTNGSLTKSGTTITFTFSAPFSYNGTDNLIVALDANEAGYEGSSDVLIGTDVGSNRTLRQMSDGANSDPLAPLVGVLTPYIGNITMNGITAICVSAAGTATLVEDCDNSQFSILVDVTDLGDSTNLEITNDVGVASTIVTATGEVTVGPFPISTPVTLTLENENDALCDVVLDSVLDSCPVDSNTLDYYNLQWPATLTFPLSEMTDQMVYAQFYEEGLTDTTVGEAAAGVEVWIGYSATDTDPSTEDWTWEVATFFGENGNNDEYNLAMQNLGLDEGTYYYATRYKFNEGPFTYGGILADGSNGDAWDGTTYVSGVLSITAPLPVANDECVDAETIVCGGQYVGNTTFALPETNDPGTCTTTAGTGGAVWYKFTGTNSDDAGAASGSIGDSVTLDLSNSTFDTKIRVFEGACEALVCVDGNDDGVTGTTSLLTVTTIVGTEYYVLVHGYLANAGEYTLDVSCEGPPTCTNATATYSVVSDCETSGGFNIEVDITDMGTATDITITDDQGSVAQTATSMTTLTFGPYTNATDVVITIADDNDVTCLQNSETLTQAVCPPANDDCAGAVALTIGTTVSGTTLGATGASGTSCNGTIGNDVWYTIVGDGGDLTVTVDSIDEDSQIGVFESEDCSGITLGSCDYSIDPFANPVVLTFPSVAGTNYYIQVGAWYSAGGPSTLDITVETTLSTSDFENKAAFTYFPNPVENTLTLNAQKTIEQVAMYNMLGQEVLRATPNALASDIDMSKLQTGTYFVKVTIANVTETIRVIKQ